MRDHVTSIFGGKGISILRCGWEELGMFEKLKDHGKGGLQLHWTFWEISGQSGMQWESE